MNVTLSSWSASPSAALRLLRVAWSSIERWDGDCDLFPWLDLTNYLRCVGRNCADAVLLEELRRVAKERADTSASSAPHQSPVTAWLKMATDAGVGDYESYLGWHLLEQPLRKYGASTVVVAILCDLLSMEVACWQRAPKAGQQKRIRAVYAAICSWVCVCPDLERELDKAFGHGLATAGGSDSPDDLLARGGELVSCLPFELRECVDRAMLPTTVLHDEVMFIRSIQMFEVIYREISWSLQAVLSPPGQVDIVKLSRCLEEAAGAITRTRALFRILTTISQTEFAMIRRATQGRSAIQSEGFADIERVCKDKIPQLLLLNSHQSHLLLAECTRLTEAWRAMKRTHWGITRKVIGTVAGTGGTTGADYLRQRADVPLITVDITTRSADMQVAA